MSIVARMQLRQRMRQMTQGIKNDEEELKHLMKQVRKLKANIKLEKKRLGIAAEELERYMNELTSNNR